MDATTILLLGTVMLGFGTCGLLFAYMTNENLRGLGWLATGFACGFLGTLLSILPGLPPILTRFPADCLVFMTFALLHVAVLDAVSSTRLLPLVPTAALMGLTVLVDTAGLLNWLNLQQQMTAVSLIVAAQSLYTASVLLRLARERERYPAYFCTFVLSLFSVCSVARAWLITGYLHRPEWDGVIFTLAYALYFAVVLSIAFGFFWLSAMQFSTQLEHLAGTDPLTRIYNRRMFLDACDREIAQIYAKQRPFSVLMVDLDHFKQVNDRYGHQVGDAALIEAVKAMQNAIRGSDVLARWGGEEFAALLPNADNDAARMVAERLRSNVEKSEIVVGSDPVQGPTILRITASIGIATYREGDNMEAILMRADQHLYLAKGLGRNRILSSADLGHHGVGVMTVTSVA